MARHVHIAIRKGKALGALRPTALFALFLVALALGLVRGAQAGGNPPGLTLGPISVNDGTVVVTGNVGDDPTAEANLDVNGQKVGVDATGNFTAVVDLDGESFVQLTLASSGGEITTIRIPVAILGSGAQGVLDELEQAGVSLEIPPDGFQIVDDQAPAVDGHVVDASKLEGLTINGQDVLSQLGPGGNFSLLPLFSGGSQSVTVVSSGHNGVTQTTSYPTTHLTTTIRTKAGTSVSAAGAKGVVIAKIRFVKRNLLKTRSLGIVVTIKDRRGYLVRGAAVHLRGMPFRYLANGASRAGFTNRLGMTRFAYRLQKQAFTQATPRRLSLLVRASTPRAAAKRMVWVRLPLLPST